MVRLSGGGGSARRAGHDVAEPEPVDVLVGLARAQLHAVRDEADVEGSALGWKGKMRSKVTWKAQICITRKWHAAAVVCLLNVFAIAVVVAKETLWSTPALSCCLKEHCT